MRRLFNWRACSADPIAGAASYDGMTIVSDSICDPRRDRVMPLLEEEQVLMCRLMVDHLRPGQLVLDVGTGSGVFAVWAALAGCRVWAIDISPRAVRFARDNARKNQVAVVRSAGSLVNGSIYLEEVAIEDFAQRHPTMEGEFDVVILNPPFNPTCPGLSAALHASAGPLGQDPFRMQIRLAPRLQKVGGHCLGYQMSYDRFAGKVGVIQKIDSAFRSNCDIQYCHVLADTPQFPVNAFLGWQYAHFLAHLSSSSGNNAALAMRRRVASYLRNVAGAKGFFSLIYYEVRKALRPISRTPRQVDIPGKPTMTWEDRVWLHRTIVEHAQWR